MFAEENDWIDIVLHEVEILNTSQIKDSLDFKFDNEDRSLDEEVINEMKEKGII